MAKEQYFVVFHENQWKIKHNDRHWDVVRLAHEERSKGHDARVLMQGTELLMTHGHDPYPPPG